MACKMLRLNLIFFSSGRTYIQARTQDFAQEGATCSQRGLQVTREPPRRLGAPRRSGAPGYQGPLGDQGPRKPGALG